MAKKANEWPLGERWVHSKSSNSNKLKNDWLDFCGDCQVYRNPYNHGKLNNWKLFLGVEKRRWVFFFLGGGLLHFSRSDFMVNNNLFFQSLHSSHWVTRVLLPSGHSPHGDGMTWESFPAKKDLIPVWRAPSGQCGCLYSAAAGPWPVPAVSCGWPDQTAGGDSAQTAELFSSTSNTSEVLPIAMQSALDELISPGLWLPLFLNATCMNDLFRLFLGGHFVLILGEKNGKKQQGYNCNNYLTSLYVHLNSSNIFM